MKFVDEFRNLKRAEAIVKKIRAIMPAQDVNIMEVCGTHTQSFYRFGIDKLLPKNLHLISGPGCPVCVSSQEYIDAAIELAKRANNIIVSFGDMLRVPGAISTLEKERAYGADVRIAYSAFDALKVARAHPEKKVIFLAVGFETTAGTIALSIAAAKKASRGNLSFLTALKLIPPAMDYLLRGQSVNIDAFLCPGHVSVIIGSRPYEYIARRYLKPCCIAGFEPVDILEGLYLLLAQIVNQEHKVENQYIRAVTNIGNIRAQKIIRKVFKVSDATWRGLGKIPKSGLKIRNEFGQFDTEQVFSFQRNHRAGLNPPYDKVLRSQNEKCRCQDVLMGLIRPNKCPLFKKICSPQNAFGPCMVSQEGACNVYYRYH